MSRLPVTDATKDEGNKHQRKRRLCGCLGMPAGSGEAPMSRAGRHYVTSQVPDPFHECYIGSLYRHPRLSVVECLGSLLKKNNETINCWSHIVGFVFFVALLLYHAPLLVHSSDSAGMLILCIGACIYTLGSTFAHTFNTMSVHARHTCFFIDYAAVSTYAFATGVAYSEYCLPMEWANGVYGQVFVPIAFLLCITSTLLSAFSRFLKVEGGCAILRVMAFTLPYLHETIPLFARFYYARSEMFHSQALILHAAHISLAVLAAIIFGSHTPERFAPGKFDFLGHSHQTMHVIGVCGTTIQIAAVYMDWQSRRFGETHHVFYCLGVMVLFILVNVMIIVVFSVRAKTLLACDGEELHCSEQEERQTLQMELLEEKVGKSPDVLMSLFMNIV